MSYKFKRAFLIGFVFLIFVASHSINTCFVSCSFNVSIQDEFTYEVIQSNIEGIFGENNLSASGLSMAGFKLEENDKFGITIDGVYEDSININYLYNDNEESNLIVSSQFKDELLFRLLLPYSESDHLIGYWNLASEWIMNDGLHKELTIFVEPNQETWDKLTNLRLDFLNKFNYGSMKICLLVMSMK